MRFFLAAVLLVAACSKAPEPAKTGSRPNFVVIMADDLGYGDLSTYGGWIDVPHIDRMAAEGLKFSDYHSNGAVCRPTRAALMTGRYQQRAGIPIVIHAAVEHPTHIDGLQEVEYTLAEMLRGQGYATGILGKWPLGYDPKYNPTYSGFDVFKGYVSGNVDFFSHVDQAGQFDWWHDLEKVNEPGYVTKLINQHAVEFIEAHSDEPFFLYVPHEAPHSPYQGPNDDPKGFRVPGDAPVRQELSGDEIKEKYREMVVEMDNGVGAILDTLQRLGLAENTLVFFISDNGAAPRGNNGPLRGFKASIWEGGHRVPAIAWHPGSIAAGSETDQLAASFDIWPTLAEFAGVPLPTERPLDGVSLVPVLQGGSVERGPLYWSFMDGLAMRDGDWKLVIGEDGNEQPLLFDLVSDLGEKLDVSAEESDRTDQMTRQAQDWLAEVEASATAQPSRELQ